MPIYEYQCQSGHVIEVLEKYDRRMDNKVCKVCGHRAVIMVSAPAKTASKWGDTPWDGRRDAGLGVTLRDENHRKQLMQQRGLREVEDGEVERAQAQAQAELDTHNKNMTTFTKAVETGASFADAMARTFPNPET